MQNRWIAEEENNFQNIEHESESKNEAVIVVSEQNITFALSKDGKTKWRLHCPKQNRIRTRRHNILTEARGLKGNTRNVLLPIDARRN